LAVLVTAMAATGAVQKNLSCDTCTTESGMLPASPRVLDPSILQHASSSECTRASLCS
jgi:hypothetical protein